jgi:benzoyl-CoA reductase/2-hydroxyglutaryl-CoA dehydratase subunit BcrC/BadD/HgdB
MGCQLLGYMPHADILLSSSYFCDGKARLNQILAGYHDRDVITLDVPNKIDKESIDYVASQLRYIAGRLEAVCGHKLDPERLRNCIRALNRGRAAYARLAEIQRSSPFPWNGINVLNMCIFGNMMNGRPIQEQLYDELVEECRAKLDSGTLPPEKFRIFWLAWYPPQPTNINSILRKNSVSIVMGEQARVYWDEMDERKPFESMALRCMQNPYVGAMEQRLANILNIVDEYNPDGVIHFSVDACRHSSAGQRLIRDALEKRGIPFMVLDGDMSDKRKYSAERTQFILENFIEVMAARK